MATASRILQPLWLNVAEQLQQFLADTDLTHKLYLAFGREFDLALAISLIQDLISGDAHPNLEILPTADINGANGAFAGSTGVVYLAEEFVSANDIETIAGVLLEELGHYLDQQLNHVDSAGDEGAIFSALVRGESLSEPELQQLKFEDDGAVANLQGQEVVIEQNTLILVNTTGDEADADPNDGVADVDLNQSGLQTTLRAAIEFANNNAGTDNIEFSIPTTDPGYDGSDYTIQPQSSLPTITEAVVIAGNDDATLPVEKIILDGSQAGLNIDGFTISADGSEISNLEISGFSENGIKLLSSDNTISNNQITANGLSGISVTGNTTTNNLLQNNYISGNTLNGIYIADNGGNTIKENTLIGNEDGIDIRNANGNVIEGNIIGRDGEGNVLRGIYIEGNDNAIGNVTLDAENTISHNGTSGVAIASGTGNSIRGNSIYDNTDLNIDLGNDGITENDPGDNDSGANNLQNSPTIVSASVNGDEVSISGNLQSTPNETFQIDFFGNNGEIFLGSQQVTTDSTGEATFSDDQSFVTTPVIPANDLGNFSATATNSDGDTSELSQDYSRRPILLLPGIGGTLAADLENGYLDWLLNRGVDPEDLQIDPLIYAYDDLIRTLENAGYISDPNSPDQDLFIANYDWRLYPGPIDNTIDGTLTGLTGDRISDDTYEYGVDYLGHFLRQATEKWNARFDGEPLASVDIIAHSTGGLVTRAYIQSDAYGDTFTSTSGETLNLPEINNFFMISVPNQGASKNWNPIHDQWIASEEFRKVYSKVINAAYQKVLAGAVVTQGGAVSGPFDPNLLHPGDISLASITDPVTGAPDPVEFIRLYVPTLNSLLATYDFIDDGNGVLTNVNNNLNIQDPNSGNQLLLDLNGGTNSFQLPDSNTFVDQVGNTIAIYGTSKATETTVTQQIGSINGEERFGIVDYSARNAESGEIWYEDNRIDNNGDGSVPLESLRGQFENDLRVNLRGFTEFSNTNSTILNETISETDDGVGHAEIVSNIDVQKLILDQLGLSLDDDQISTDLLASRAERIWSYVNGNISTVISDPVETLFVDGDGNRLGYSSATGVLNEIPNSIYFGKEDGIGWVFGPVKTPVELHLTGLGEDYYVQVSSDQAGVSTGITDSGFLAAGTQKIIDVPIPASYQGTNLCDIVSGVDDVLRTFQSVVDSEIYALALPLLGDNLKDITEDGVQFLTDLQANIVTPLREICNSDNVTSALIFEVINLTLGSSGLNILGDLNGDGIFDAQDIEINETEDDLSFRFSIDDAFTFNTPLEADMGLPGLGLEVDGDAEITFNYGFTLGFGVNKDDGFYFDTSADSELEIGLDVSTPELETTGKLAFLQLDVRDKQDDPSHLDATFKVDIQDPDDIGKLAANEIPQVRFETKLEMAADVNLELEANFDEAAKFPKITTDFHLDWDSNNSKVDHNNPQDLGNKPNIEFKNVTLDTGSFFGNFVDPILGTVQSITEPVQPIIELLTQEIDLQFMKFSLLDLAVLLDDVDQDDIDFVNSIAQVIDVINEIPENLSTDGINLGGFDLGAFDIRTPGADTSQVEPNVSQEEDEILEGSDEAAFLDALEVIPGDGLQFPLLTNPLKAFDLLLGKNVELFTYGLPKFDFNLGYNQYFPILGPLGINLGGEIGAELSLPGFGYDTTGLRQFAEGGDLGDIFNGFYVSDTENADGTGEDIPEVSLTGGFEAAVEVNAGALSFGGGGGLYTGVDFNLNDPNDDGKIRTDEFIDLIDDPECLFDLYLDLTARLFAYLKIGFGFFSVTQRVDSPDLKLVELEHNCKGSRDPDPGSSLATQNGKVLELNTGAGEDDFTLEHVAGTAGNETLLVDAEGAVEEYSGINKIFADGKAKDDYIALDESVLVPAEMFGSGGDDFLIGGSGDDTLYGERGVDKLDGGKGDDTLEGRDGDDFLIGGPGQDTLWGGDGDDTASYITAEEGVVVNFTSLGLNTGDAVGDFFDRIDHIEGSLYGDTLVGNDKKNLLVGLAGDDTLEGLAGKDTLEGGSGNDTLKGGEDNDILAGGAGSDDIRGGEGEDTASYASSPNGVVLDLQDPSQSTGHAAGDTFQFIENYEGSYHNDTLKGNAQSDEFFGLDGNDVLLGGGGADTLDGGEGYDIASYEDSPTGLLIDIGSPGKSTGFATDDKYVDMEEIQGSSFSDVLMGDNKDNILDGLEGDNLLIGGNGIGNSADDLRAGQGNDTYQLNGKKANGSIIRDRGGNYDLLFLEDFTLSLSGPSQGIAGLARENNALIIDINEDGVIDRDDDLTIKKFFSPRNASVNDVEILEGDNGTKQAIFTVTVDSQDSGAGVGFIETLQNLRGIDVIDFFNTVDVDFETKNGSATATDQDYQPTSGTLSFAPDETTKTVTVDILGDLKEESDEYFTLNLSADNTNIVDSSGKGTIANDDTSISITNQVVTEGDDGTVTANLTVSLSQASQEIISVDYTTQSQTAVANSDYTPTSGTLIFNPGETTKVITVDVIGDTDNELDETFKVELSNAVNAGFITKEASITVLNDDDPDIYVDDFTVLEGDSGVTTANFTVTLSESTPEQVSVAYSTFNDTAIAGLDYVPKSGFLTFQPGETQKEIAVDIIGEKWVEPNEKFTLELSNSINGTIVDGRGVGNIRNEDNWEFSTRDIIFAEGDSGITEAIFTVELSDVHAETVTVEYATADDSAIADIDYISTSGTLSFAPGEREKTLTVEVIGDEDIENDEQFFLNLSNASTGIITTPETTGIIRNDDYPNIAITDTTLEEGDDDTTQATVTVSLSEPVNAEVTVDYDTEAGTAEADLDYVRVQGQLTFAPGETEKTIIVPINGETLVETDETFTVKLSNARNGHLIDDEAEITLENDDFVQISIKDVTVSEFNDVAKLTVILSDASDAKLTVDYITEDETAKSGSDYITTNGTLTFLAGETSQTITIPLVDDLLPEATENFWVNLFNPSGSNVLADNQGIVTIEDNDDDIPVAWWRLDETTGIIAEDSIEDNDGLLQNGPTWIIGRVNGGLAFDGIDDFVNVTDDDVLDVGTENFSISAWVKIFDGSGIILDKRIQASGPVQGYALSHDNIGRLRFQMTDGTVGGGVNYLSTASIADGQWHHITVTVDRDDTQGGDFYIDGVQDGSFDPTTASGSLSNSRDLLFGRHSDSPTPNYFQGALDEVKLFKTALTDSEVLSLYESANDSGEDPNKNENGIPSNGIPDVFNPNVLTPDITASPVLEVETAENTTATEITESTFKSSASLENAEESTFSQSFLAGTSDVSALTDDEDLLGELNGQIWYDQNNNNTQEGDEPGLAGWVVFLDANGNAQFDPDEAFTVTDDKGDYAFTGLDAGTYRLAQVRHDGWVQTYPETEINGDFESGTFADWQTIGDYSIEPTAVDAPFKLGNYQAEITTDIDSVPVEDLEDFLGLTQGSLNTLAETFADSFPEEEIIRNTVTEGSAIAKTITVEAGDTLTFDWNFITFDYLYFMDFGFFSISSATDNTEILASVDTSYALSPADVSVETGLQSFSHTFTTSGEYTIGVGVVDAGDHIVDSALRLDNFTLTANEYSVELKDGESVDNLDFGNYLPGLPQTIQFAAANYSVTGEGTDAEITLTRSGDVSQSADVTVQLNSGTADGGSDFDAADKLVKFAPGETSKTFTIAILEDASAEDNEDFFLSLTSTSDAEIGAQSTATVTIIDTDTVVNFAQPTYQINEDGSAVGAEITVIRTGDRSSSSEVKLFFEDGTAIGGDPFVEFGEDKFGETTLELLFPEGVDFDQSKVESSTGEFISTRTVFFAPGEESQTVKFPIHDDDIREGTEFFNLYLLNTGDPLVSSQKRTEIQIIDNEGADITGSVWHDWNRNRHWDVGELGLSDWTVYIDANDNQQLDAEEISTVTDANGFYSFSGLEEGTYTIAEVLQEDWQQTFPGQDPGFVHRVSVNLGDEVTHVDFGNFNETLGAISGYKWHDRDRDGIWDDNEATLSGWMIYLDDNNNGELDPGEIATVTDAEGAYSFTGLKSDTYTVAEVMQPGWAQSYPFQNSTGSNAHTVFINPGEQVDKIDFGNFYTAADPVAWWRLDETAGIIADDSIGTNDGLLQNGPTWITGRVNGALSFDGIDDFVNVADDDVLDVGSDDFSLSAWVKIYDGSGIILDKRIQASGPAQGYVLSHTNNGRLNFQMADGTSGGGVSYLSTASISDGQWHHITVTVDRDDTQGGDFYIDGVKDGSFDPTMALGSLSNSRNLLFGRNSDSPTPNYFQGALDEVKLFKADLTASDVLSLYEDADKNNLHDPITAVSPISSTASNEILVSPEGDDLTNHNLPEPTFQPFSDSDVGSKVENDNSLVNPSEAPILGSVNLNQSHENSLINVGNDSLLPNMFGLLGQEGSDLAIMRQ